METIQSIYPYLIAVALTAMTYIYRSYIKNLISKPATIEKNLFFKRTPWPTKPVNTAATTQKVTVFKESISQITFHISGKGARVYKSYYEGQQNIKLEHSRQKALFCETNLTITNKIDASKAVKKFSNEIFNEIFIDEKYKALTELVIVSGKIGCGKSTIINNWRICLSDYYTNLKLEGHFICIYIDIRVLYNDSIRGNYEFSDEKIVFEFKNALFNKIKQQISPTESLKEVYSSCQNIEEIVAKAIKYGHKVYVFLDELDVLYYEFCKFITNPKETITLPPEIKVFHKILDVIFNLSVISEFNKLYGVFKIIVAVRTSSYKLFMEIYNERNHEISNENKLESYRTIQLDVGTWEALSLYLKVKIDYAVTDLRKDVSDANKTIVENLSYIKNNLYRVDKNEIDAHLKLSVHGIRHSFKLFDKLIEIDGTCTLLKDFIFNPKLLRLFQYTDGSDVFSQTSEGVSNLFLVNVEYALDLYKKTQENNKPALFNTRLLKSHLHTYWLKILILSYFDNECNKKNRVFIESNEIYEIFSSQQDSTLKYEEELITLILFHLTEVRHGRLLTVMSKDRHTIELHPTLRVKALFDGNIMYSFSYLMVVIEDMWLQFPEYCVKEFAISNDKQRTSYFLKNLMNLSDDDKYNFIIYKLKLVILFTYIINAYLKIEKNRYAHIFEKLNEKGIYPNPENLGFNVQNLIIESDELCKKMLDTRFYTDEKNILKISRTMILKIRIRTQFNNYLLKRSYCYPGWKQSLKGMMKNYHTSRKSGYNDLVQNVNNIQFNPKINIDNSTLNN